MCFGDQVYMVSLNGEMDEAKVGTGGRGDGTLEHREQERTAQRAQVGTGTEGDVEGKTALVLGAGAMEDNGARTGLAPRTFAAATPGTGDRQRELALACHLD